MLFDMVLRWALLVACLALLAAYLLGSHPPFFALVLPYSFMTRAAWTCWHRPSDDGLLCDIRCLAFIATSHCLGLLRICLMGK